MRVIVEQNLRDANYWLSQEISSEERKMWLRMKRKCERLLREEK